MKVETHARTRSKKDIATGRLAIHSSCITEAGYMYQDQIKEGQFCTK